MQMTRLAVWVVVVLAMALTAARGQQIQQPVVADRTTPRGTLKVLALAMQKAEPETLRAILLASTPSEQQMVEAMVQTAQAVRKLHDAAIATYGAEQAKVITGVVEDLEYLDEAVTLPADPQTEATVTFTDVDQRPVKLIKRGEEWFVPVAELAQNMDAGTIDGRLAEIRSFVGVMESVTDEVAQKKHRTAEEAKQAMYNRMMQAAAPPASPATQPATAPATQPIE